LPVLVLDVQHEDARAFEHDAPEAPTADRLLPPPSEAGVLDLKSPVPLRRLQQECSLLIREDGDGRRGILLEATGEPNGERGLAGVEAASSASARLAAVIDDDSADGLRRT
jgi:hypothetical protein